MTIYGDVESINLSTGERQRRVAGNGESRLEIEGIIRKAWEDTREARSKERAGEIISPDVMNLILD